MCKPRRPLVRRGFSLVELLAVVGIIAVLMAILVPSLSRARESSRRVNCLSNLKQLGTAMMSYCNDNMGYLPHPAPYSGLISYDWIFWEPGRNLGGSAIAKYLGQPTNRSTFVCPDDDTTVRTRTTNSSYGPYPYSYVMNAYLTAPGSDPGKLPMSTYRLMGIKSPASKTMLYEEDEHTIDDGFGTPDVVNINLLSIRHDRKRRLPDDAANGLSLNGDRRGNAAYCDGHADYPTRREFHRAGTYDPAASPIAN